MCFATSGSNIPNIIYRLFELPLIQEAVESLEDVKDTTLKSIGDDDSIKIFEDVEPFLSVEDYEAYKIFEEVEPTIEQMKEYPLINEHYGIKYTHENIEHIEEKFVLDRYFNEIHRGFSEEAGESAIECYEFDSINLSYMNKFEILECQAIISEFYGISFNMACRMFTYNNGLYPSSTKEAQNIIKLLKEDSIDNIMDIIDNLIPDLIPDDRHIICDYITNKV
jgi:hypothetical protein